MSSSSTYQTVALVGTVPVGIALFEIEEEMPAEYSGEVRGYVKTDTTTPEFERKLRRREWISMHAMGSGRFGVWLYSPYDGVEWSESFCEKQRGQLEGKFAAIVKAAASQAPSIAARYKVVHEQREADARRTEEEWQRYLAKEEDRKQKELAAERARNEREAREKREALERESRAELFSIIDDWFARAKVATFIDTIDAELGALDELRRAAVEERLALAREIFAQRDPVARLLAWKTADERGLADDSRATPVLSAAEVAIASEAAR